MNLFCGNKSAGKSQMKNGRQIWNSRRAKTLLIFPKTVRSFAPRAIYDSHRRVLTKSGRKSAPLKLKVNEKYYYGSFYFLYFIDFLVQSFYLCTYLLFPINTTHLLSLFSTFISSNLRIVWLIKIFKSKLQISKTQLVVCQKRSTKCKNVN